MKSFSSVNQTKFIAEFIMDMTDSAKFDRIHTADNKSHIPDTDMYIVDMYIRDMHCNL